MNFLLLGMGSRGDVNPFLGLGKALKKRGHGVTIVANEVFGDLATDMGLGFDAVGTAEQYDQFSRDPRAWSLLRSMEMLAEVGMKFGLEQGYEVIKKHHEASKDLVVVSSTLGCFSARTAEDKLGIILAGGHLQPSVIRSIYDPPGVPGPDLRFFVPRFVWKGVYTLLDKLLLDRAFAGPLNDFRKLLGLPRVKNIFGSWIFPSRCNLVFFPEWYAAPQVDWPANSYSVGFPLEDGEERKPMGDDLEAFLNSGSPPVALTFGSAMLTGGKQFDTGIKACQKLGLRGLLLGSDSGQIPKPLPDGFFHRDFIPLGQILPRCSAVVHHGGIGTLSQAIISGIPQVIAYMAYDQPDNAARIQRLKLGRGVSSVLMRPGSLARALKKAIGDPDISKAIQLAKLSIDPEKTWELSCQHLEALVPDQA